MENGKDARLKAYLARIMPSGSIDELAERVGGPEVGDMDDVSGVVKKLARGETLDRREQFKLEAIIIPDKRPAIDILEGDFEVRHPLWRHWNEARVKKPLRKAIRSVGRIELPGHPRLPYGGTGFVVGNGLLMTNRHVAEIFSTGLGLRQLDFIPGRRAAIDFLHEYERPQSILLSIRSVVMIHPYWDMALLRVEGLGPEQAPLQLSLVPPEQLVREEVAVIGYPAFDPRNPADVQNEVFGGVYEVKRLQPGLLHERCQIESYGSVVPAIAHDSSTLGGDSGAAVVDPKTGHVVAVHFSGAYLLSNYGVPAFDLGRDGRVIDAGVLFAGDPVRGPTPWDTCWRGNEKAIPTVAASAATRDVGNDMTSHVSSSAAQDSASFAIPLEVTVRFGQAALIGAVAIPNTNPAAAATERMVEPIHDLDYSTRRGYDPGFLGFDLPLPKAADETVLAHTASGMSELRYHHFSILMHKKRRLALMTASNLDASKVFKRPEPRPAEDYTRDGLGGLGSSDQERWFRDDRIASNEQLSDRFFNLDKKVFDKGHLVRRDDVAWGATYAELQAANGDTYHITNCSPQVKGFNRSSDPGSDTNWGDLENLVLSQADTERLSVFSGPVLEAGDRIFVGVDDIGPVQVQIPSRYWKVIVAKKAGKLESFGFLLQQDLSDAGLEFAVPDNWRPFMIALDQLELLTGVVFPTTMRDGDQIATGAGESVRRGADAALVAATVTGKVDDRSADIEPILTGWRMEQKAGQGEGTRFVLNFSVGQQPNDDAIAKAASMALGLSVEVRPLFDPDPDLDRHRILTIAGVTRLDRSDMFEIARLLRDTITVETVDPDLGSDYYDWDGFPETVGRESADAAFWCWADDADKPADPDWAITTTNVPKAWAFSEAAQRPSRGEGIRVFQPDTGVVASHPELPPNAASNAAAANLLEIGKPPIDPMSGGSNPGHGTATGSVVASPEGGAMRGSAPRATLVPVRCLESVAVFDQSRVAKAIDHARLNGAHVITMSLGGVFSAALHAALRKAVDANIIVVAAAGNCVGTVVWPARYEEAIAVGGVNAAFKPWRGSSHGSAVDVSGPAEFVLRADARVPADPGAVSGGQGTSFATAHLAGLAALWLAHHGRAALLASLPPGVKLQHVFRSLVRMGAIVPSGFDTSAYGAGIADAHKLLQLDPTSALGQEAVFADPASNMRRQVAELVAESMGAGGLEAAAPALSDMQNAAELACLALDRLRAGRSRRALVEAMPPQAVSPGLRRVLGAKAHELTRMGGGHV